MITFGFNLQSFLGSGEEIGYVKGIIGFSLQGWANFLVPSKTTTHFSFEDSHSVTEMKFTKAPFPSSPCSAPVVTLSPSQNQHPVKTPLEKFCW